jgi:hypothetical protein
MCVYITIKYNRYVHIMYYIAYMLLTDQSANFAALIFSTVDLLYRAKKAKEFFPCSKELFSFLSPVHQMDHAIFTEFQYKK